VSRPLAVSAGEDYPVLFVSDDPGELAYARSPAAAQISRAHRTVVIELTSAEYADWRETAERYWAWIGKLSQMRHDALDSRLSGCGSVSWEARSEV
jgi:hypothetical protein